MDSPAPMARHVGEATLTFQTKHHLTAECSCKSEPRQNQQKNCHPTEKQIISRYRFKPVRFGVIIQQEITDWTVFSVIFSPWWSPGFQFSNSENAMSLLLLFPSVSIDLHKTIIQNCNIICFIIKRSFSLFWRPLINHQFFLFCSFQLPLLRGAQT